MASPTTDLMQGWGSILSAIFAALAFSVAVALYLHERQTRREERQRIEAQQANLVLLQVRPEVFPGGKTAIYYVAGEVLNESEAQICAITTQVTDMVTGRISRGQEVLLPKGNRFSWQVHVPEEPLGPADLDSIALLARFRISAVFADANGRSWRREGLDPPVLRPSRLSSRWERLTRLHR